MKKMPKPEDSVPKPTLADLVGHERKEAFERIRREKEKSLEDLAPEFPAEHPEHGVK